MGATVRGIAAVSNNGGLGAASLVDTTGYLDKLNGKGIAQEMLRQANARNPKIEAAVYVVSPGLSLAHFPHPCALIGSLLRDKEPPFN